MTTILYSYTTETGRELVVKRHSSGALQIGVLVDTEALHALLPDTPAERMRLAAAILDPDMPEVVEHLAYLKAGDGLDEVSWTGARAGKPFPLERFRQQIVNAISIARHLDAQSAAKAEAEQRDAEQVETEAERLRGLYIEARRATGFEIPDDAVWDRTSDGAKDAWRAVARDSLARQNGVTS